MKIRSLEKQKFTTQMLMIGDIDLLKWWVTYQNNLCHKGETLVIRMPLFQPSIIRALEVMTAVLNGTENKIGY